MPNDDCSFNTGRDEPFRFAVAGQVGLHVPARRELGEHALGVQHLVPRPLRGEHDRGAAGRERPCDTQPDPLAAARHQCRLAVEHISGPRFGEWSRLR